jgi:hypothetical protein
MIHGIYLGFTHDTGYLLGIYACYPELIHSGFTHDTGYLLGIHACHSKITEDLRTVVGTYSVFTHETGHLFRVYAWY